MIFWQAGLDLLALDPRLQVGRVGGQFALHQPQDPRLLSSDVSRLLGDLVDVEQHELGVLRTRFRSVGHAGRGVVPSV